MVKQKKVIVVLVILLVLALFYIGLMKYGGWRKNEDLKIFQQGAQYGYEQAIVQIMQQAESCEQVPLYVENNTINLIAVGCLKNE